MSSPGSVRGRGPCVESKPCLLAHCHLSPGACAQVHRSAGPLALPAMLFPCPRARPLHVSALLFSVVSGGATCAVSRAAVLSASPRACLVWSLLALLGARPRSAACGACKPLYCPLPCRVVRAAPPCRQRRAYLSLCPACTLSLFSHSLHFSAGLVGLVRLVFSFGVCLSSSCDASSNFQASLTR